MSRIPLLIYSDAPEGFTGLGRITRDLATHLTQDLETQEIFEIATYGYNSIGSKHLPWTQYRADSIECVTYNFRRVWEDFSEGSRGVLMPITPPSWLFGFARPDKVAQENPKLSDLCQWLLDKPFEIWPYLAIETQGPKGLTTTQSAEGGFTVSSVEVIKNVDRPLFYSKWGAKMASESIKDVGFEWIHHGLCGEHFKRSNEFERIGERHNLGVDDKTLVVGCVATNTGRKAFGQLFEIAALLKELRKGEFCLWLHTDRLIGHWSLPALFDDFGLQRGDVYLTLSSPQVDDKWLSRMYSACDVTILPSLGEGFGYPVVESMLCGTPCIVGEFGAQSELVLPSLHISTVSTYIDGGIHTFVRPVYNSKHWAGRIEDFFLSKAAGPTFCREHALQWDWSTQWPKFRKWFFEGATNFKP